MSIDDLAPLRVIAITDTETRQAVFGVHIHNGMDSIEADQVSTDDVVRQYIQEFCSDCYIRSNRLDTMHLDNSFEGLVCFVSEEPSSLKQYSISVKRFYSSSKEFWWWMDKLHHDGGWADQLEYSRTGQFGSADPDPTDDNWWDNFWESYGHAVIFSLFAAVVLFAIHTMTDAFSDKDN